MKFIKLLTIFTIALVVFSCSTQSISEKEPEGRIAFAVQSVQSATHRFNTNISVEVVIRHQKSGETHKGLFEFGVESFRRVEYFENLVPGIYVIEEYTSAFLPNPFVTKLETVVEIEVKPGETALSPLYVNMSAIYPSGGLSNVGYEGFWDDYNLNE